MADSLFSSGSFPCKQILHSSLNQTKISEEILQADEKTDNISIFNLTSNCKNDVKSDEPTHHYYSCASDFEVENTSSTPAQNHVIHYGVEAGEVFETAEMDIIDEIIHNGDNFNGSIPEYNNVLSKYVSLITKRDMNNMLNDETFKTDDMKKALYELVIAALDKQYEDTKKDTALSPAVKDLKLKVYKDYSKAIKSMYDKSGLKEQSWLEKTALKLPEIAAKINSKWNGASDVASKLMELALKHSKKGSLQDIQPDLPADDLHREENMQMPADKLSANNMFIRNNNGSLQANPEYMKIMNGRTDLNAQNSINDINIYIQKLKKEGNLNNASEQIRMEYISSSSRYEIRLTDVKEKTYNKTAANERTAVLLQDLEYMVQGAKLTTPELKAAYYSLEETACNEKIKKIEEELNNRSKNINGSVNSEYSSWSVDELTNGKKFLEDDRKTLHGLYRSVVPSWWNENSEKVSALLISVCAMLAEHSEKGKQAARFIPVLSINFN